MTIVKREAYVNQEVDRLALDHAWRYFELHANHRLSMFNFFVAFSTVALAGLGAAMQAGPKFAVPATFIGFVIPLVSALFWELDRRTAFLVKHAEASLCPLEERLFPPDARPFSTERSKFSELRNEHTSVGKRLHSYRQAFAAAFLLIGLLGIGGAVYSIWTG